MIKPAKAIHKLLEKYGKKSDGWALTEHGGQPALAFDDGGIVPLLPWRYERRFLEMREIIASKQLDGVSAVKILKIGGTGSLINTLYREADIAMWLADSTPLDVFADFNGDHAANVFIKLQNGVLCCLELMAEPSLENAVTDKHTVITSRGLACDLAVDTQIKQDSVYVYKDGNKRAAYTDTDFELYGLDPEETALARCCFDVLINRETVGETFKQRAVLLKTVTDAALNSYEHKNRAVVREAII